MLHPRILEITDGSLGLKKGHRIFTSLEGENPGGSIKDHMVLGELTRIENLRSSGFEGVSEVSAGSTALSLAYYCHKLEKKCVLFVPTTADAEIVRRLKAYGAEVHQEDMSVIYEKYEQLMEDRPGLYRFNQLFDEDKRLHYHHFGLGVKEELGALNAILGAVGTGHSLRGISEGVGSAVPTITAEPDENYKIAGVRNILLNRYGDQDALAPSCFSARIVVPKSRILDLKTLRTNQGLISVGSSFALALSAVVAYLGDNADQADQKIFIVGASNKQT